MAIGWTRQSNPLWVHLSRPWPNARYRALILRRKRGQERRVIKIEDLDDELMEAFMRPHFGLKSTSDEHLYVARRIADVMRG